MKIVCPICAGKGTVENNNCNYCKGRNVVTIKDGYDITITRNNKSVELTNESLIKKIRGSNLLPSDTNQPIMWHGITCSKGWYGIIYDAINGLSKVKEDNPDCSISIAQVKEKFGQLRIYIDTEGCSKECRKKLYSVISEAENKANRTCERCGSTENVETKGPGWVSTLCRKCRVLKEKDREKFNES